MEAAREEEKHQTETNEKAKGKIYVTVGPITTGNKIHAINTKKGQNKPTGTRSHKSRKDT